MPKYRITFPSGEAVVITSDHELSRAEQLQAAQSTAPKSVAVGPEATAKAAKEEMASAGPLDKVMYGIGRAPRSIYEGTKQLFTGQTGASQEAETTQRALDKAGGAAATTGRVIGEIGMTALPMAKAAQAASRIPRVAASVRPGLIHAATGMAGSAGVEALRPTLEGESRGENALHGAGWGAVGSAVGAVLPRAARAARLLPSDATRQLTREGVHPTLGQSMGGWVNRLEEAAMSVPVLGSAIRAGRRGAMEQFSDSAVARVARGLGLNDDAIAAIRQADNPLEVVQNLAGRAYDQALQGRAVPQSVGDDAIRRFQDVWDDPYLLPEAKRVLEGVVRSNIVGRFPPQGAPMPAEVWKKIDSELGSQAAARAGSSDQVSKDVAQGLRRLQAQWRDSLGTAVGGDMGQRLNDANAVYRDLVRVNRAAGYAGADQGLVTPARLARAEAAAAQKLPAGGRAVPRGQQVDFARAGQEVLGNKVPDSGTPERALTALLGRNLFEDPVKTVGGLALAAPGGLLYSGPGRWATSLIPGEEEVARALTQGIPAVGRVTDPRGS